MITVQHDTLDTFFDELTGDADRVHAGIIRMTGLVDDETTPDIAHIYLKAGYMIVVDGEYELRELIVYTGDDGDTDNEGTVNCETLCMTLTHDATELGLEVRSGEYA